MQRSRCPRGTSFADAEAPEQGVEHVLDAGPAGDPVERGPRLAQRFGDDQQVAGAFSLPQASRGTSASAARWRALSATSPSRRQQRPRTLDQQSDEIVQPSPVMAETRRRPRAARAAEDRPWRWIRIARSRSGTVVGLTQPQDQVGRRQRCLGALDADRLDRRRRCREGRPCRPAGTARRRSPIGASIRSRVVPGDRRGDRRLPPG